MISFIIIGRNEGWKLKKCLQSILECVESDNIKEYEIIYVDSQSTDRSISIAKEIGCNRIYRIDGEYNSAIARNIGADEARGISLFFIDGDMELQPGFIPKVVDTESGKMYYPFVSGCFDNYFYDSKWNYLYSKSAISLKEKRMESTTGGLFMIDRELWHDMGGMHNEMSRCEDLDLGYRIHKKGFSLLRYPETIVKHHTTQYIDRRDYVKAVKWTSYMLKLHYNDIAYLRAFIVSQYTSILLLASIILTMFCGPICLCLYLLSLAYKIFSSYKKTKHSIPIIHKLLKLVQRDLLFFYYLLFFHPENPGKEYTQI